MQNLPQAVSLFFFLSMIGLYYTRESDTVLNVKNPINISLHLLLVNIDVNGLKLYWL